jgi:hypothetical protein
VDLPSNIRSLSLNCNNTSLMEHLPDTIEELNLGPRFNLNLDNLPSSIKKIIFDKNDYYMYNEKLNCLPNQLEILQLPANYIYQIFPIPKSLVKVICSKYYKFRNDFSDIEVCQY